MGRALGLLIGFALDRALGDPARWHPVAGFGSIATAVEKCLYADNRRRGVAFCALLVGGTGALARLAPRGTVTTAVATWAVLGGRSLEREAHAVTGLRLPEARERLKSLVGRDASGLDESGVARAVVESVAENTCDAVVAPLLWGGLAGVPGLVVYRAANTLDAMVGHRSDRYRNFGWASARLDDVLNYGPARITALLAAFLAPCVGGDSGQALDTWRHDAHRHPSPNAGPIEAAFAGALDVQLGGVNVYDGAEEDRHTLGSGRPPEGADVARATVLARAVGWAAVALAAGVATARRRD